MHGGAVEENDGVTGREAHDEVTRDGVPEDDEVTPEAERDGHDEVNGATDDSEERHDEGTRGEATEEEGHD